MCQSIRQIQTLKQIQVQQLAQQLSLRLGIIKALRGERYEPKAKCPKCGRKMTAVEIIKGFTKDPKDFTTACSGCGRRFEPNLVCYTGRTRMELPFFCSIQTLDQLKGKEALSPKQLAEKHTAIYRAAIVHHGSLRQAFAKIGVEYPLEEIADWQNKIRQFLGQMPDTVIAGCVNKSARAIRAIRRQFGVPRYRARDFMEV